MGGPDLLTDLLRDVSRSFYLTLRVLPRSVRPQIGVTYLLARATDTIADTTIVPVDQRVEALQQLRLFIAGGSLAAPDLNRFGAGGDTVEGPADAPASTGKASPAELHLLGRVGETIDALRKFSEADQRLIRTTLDTITSGQLLDLERFARLPKGKIHALESEGELDDYLYRVAGCVGEFWTRICRAHVFPNANLDDATMLENGVRYGKGLQLTNILRDIPRDLSLGRCYLPLTHLRTHGLRPEDELQHINKQVFSVTFEHFRRAAIDHLKAGWAYTNSLPRSCVRIRLACAWPILIGKKTLDRLAEGPENIEGQPVKISRRAVRKVLLRSLLVYPWPRLWAAQWREEGEG
jgi:farnesyl-diphosphate farnesyltransferase